MGNNYESRLNIGMCVIVRACVWTCMCQRVCLCLSASQFLCDIPEPQSTVLASKLELKSTSHGLDLLYIQILYSVSVQSECWVEGSYVKVLYRVCIYSFFGHKRERGRRFIYEICYQTIEVTVIDCLFTIWQSVFGSFKSSSELFYIRIRITDGRFIRAYVNGICYCFMATFRYIVGSRGNGLRWKMKHPSDSRAGIWMRMLKVCVATHTTS